MEKRLNIGVDVDGVLADFTGAARTLCKQMFDGKPDDALVQTEWGFDSVGITREEEKRMWRQIDSTLDWWLNLKRLPNTNLLYPLCEQHRVVFITNRKDGTGLPIEEQTAEWLRTNFHIWNPSVVISDNKGPLAAGLKLDYFIDDRPKNVEEVANAIGAEKSIMCRWPWSPEFQKPFPFWVQNFDEFAYPNINYGPPDGWKPNGFFDPDYLHAVTRCT